MRIAPSACTRSGVPVVLLAVGMAGAASMAASRPPMAAVQSAAAVAAPAADGARARFLEMFARAYFPGRTGQILIVPREGDIITRDDPDLPYMHGSPWPYDTEIPLLFVGRHVKAGSHATPAVQQDVAVTIAAAVGLAMPRSASGRVLPVLDATAARPRAVLLVVLDGMRRDYVERHAGEMPTLSQLRGRGAWFTNARVNYVPTNTAVGHTTIATGADPRIHGVTGNNLFDRVARRRHDTFDGWDPRELMALTLADVWQLETRGKGLVIAQGSSVPAATALGGHGACQLNGTRPLVAGYDEDSGRWKTNPACFTLPADVAELDARTLWPSDGQWMGHRVNTPSRVRRSGLFPRFEADAFLRLIDAQPVGKDDVPDLLLWNYKSADYVGHKHGPGSRELTATLSEMDRHLARVLAALEAKTGGDHLLVVTADHGMPSEPEGAGRRHVAPAVIDLIHTRFDPDARALVPYYEPENGQIFVDHDRLAALTLTLKDVAAFLESQPFVFAAFTEEEVRRAAGEPGK